MKIKHSLKRTLAGAGIVAAVSVSALAAPAQAAGTPYIVGGQPASSPYIVQLAFHQNYDNSSTYGCTGEALNNEWVLTAKHCTDGTTSMNVYFSNDTSNRGQAVAADELEQSPYGDVALVHLSRTHDLDEYAPLADSYTPRAGDTGDIYGYGLRANKQPTDHLYTSSVQVLGESSDAYRGRAVHVRGVSGASNHGDSGGPLVINGQIVGVCSTGDSADPGANTRAGSNYANLSDSRDWIYDYTGA